jgi:DNA-binding transcriptional LysR family regulator
VVMGYGALAIHAAMAGKGLAVGDSLLCHDALRSGDIVRVGTHTFPGREDYWISRHPDATSNEMASRVMEWVRSEVRRMEN